MASRTKNIASHRGEPRRCVWRSSCASALLGGVASDFAIAMQTNALVLPTGDVRYGAGPPG